MGMIAFDKKNKEQLERMRKGIKCYANEKESEDGYSDCEDGLTSEDTYALAEFLYEYASSKNVLIGLNGASMECIFRVGDKYVFLDALADYEDPDFYDYEDPDYNPFLGYQNYMWFSDDLDLGIAKRFEYFQSHGKIKGSLRLDPIDVDYLFDFYKRVGFEDRVTSKNVVEQFLDNSEWLDENIGSVAVSRMFGYDQKNSHHCYDLMEHTLRTVEGIRREDLTEEEFTKLRVAAFFHDIAKPDVASFNEKTGQQVYYGHAARSVEVARPTLEELGYSEEEIAEISFYIGHHDDFISYKSNMQPWMLNHEHVRGIDSDTVSEVVIKNKYDFEAMGYDEHQIKYILYTLGHNGIEPKFMVKDQPVEVHVDMDEVRQKIDSGEYNKPFIPTKRNYEMLLRLCEADVLAQSEVAMQNGKQVGSKKEKVEVVNSIQTVMDEAFESVSVKIPEYSDDFIQRILQLAAKKVDSREQSEKAQALLKEFEKAKKQKGKDNDSIGE